MLSLATCKRLRDAGWVQERTPYYRIFLAVENIDCADDHWDKGSPTTACFLASIPDNLNFVACPTLEELLEAVDGMTTKTLMLDNAEDGWTCSIGDVHQTNGGYGFTDPSEAVAALWLKLKDVV